MKVAFIARSTLYKVHGGITVQVHETAKSLRKMGVEVDICLTDRKIDYKKYDLLHFFDITRPANILCHLKKSGTPFVISPILIDYSEYDKQHRTGLTGFVFSLASANANEYIKTISRWLLRKDKLQSKSYLWKGQDRSMKYILQHAEMILPNSKREYEQLNTLFPLDKPYLVVPNGIDDQVFQPEPDLVKDEKLVLCAARIEGLKNQLNLIKALNNTEFKLILAGNASSNQQKYFRLCKKTAARNIFFVGKLTHTDLLEYYKKAKVHILPSWFETCGLSSMEAAAMGCNIVITDKGFPRDYFADDAFYCDPGNEESIYQSVKKASESPSQKKLQEKILANYTWAQAASKTIEAYNKIVAK